MAQESTDRAKQNLTIRKRYKKINMDLVKEQGAPLSDNKSELVKPLVIELFNLGATRAKTGGQVLSPEQLFRVCLYSLNIELRNFDRIDQNKALELYKCVPGAVKTAISVPEIEVDEYDIGNDIIIRHSVISTRARAIILGYSEKVRFDGDNYAADDNSDVDGDGDDGLDDDNGSTGIDINIGDNNSTVTISDSEEDQLNDDQSGYESDSQYSKEDWLF